MRSRRSRLDKEASRLMGMSGIEVYEERDDWGEEHHFYGIVWRGKRRWSIHVPWDANKYALEQVGRSLRRTADYEEAVEKLIRQSEDAEEKKKLEDADIREVMVRDVKRTVIDKPLYFY